jgi:hypothetical protein
MISNLQEIRKWKVRPWSAAMFALSTAPESLPRIAYRLGTLRLFGNPLLSGLALIGLIVGVRQRETWAVHAVLMVIVGGSSFALLMVPMQYFYNHERYLFPCLPPMLIWAANGIASCSRWAEILYARVAAPTRKLLPSIFIRAIISGSLALLLTWFPVRALRDVADLQQGWVIIIRRKNLGCG